MKILATSGGFLPTDLGPFQWQRGPLIEHAIELAGNPDRPRFCYVGTATGDSLNGTAGFYRAFAGSDVRASHLELFMMPNVDDVRAHLLSQDVIWVGGGSVANLLAVWRTHRLDEVLRECWEEGVVLGGVSAGSICWYVGGRPTASAGTCARCSTGRAAAVRQRRALRLRGAAPAVAAPSRRRGHAAQVARHRDGVGLVTRARKWCKAVTRRRGASAYVVERGPDGTAVETRVEPRLLAADYI